MTLVVRNPVAYAGDRDANLILELGTYPGGGHGNQHSRLEDPMDRGAWQATVHRITKSKIQLKQLSAACMYALQVEPFFLLLSSSVSSVCS